MPIQQMFLGAGGGFTAGTYTGTRGVIAGGQQGGSDGWNAQQMYYITIQTTGNSTDFGNMVVGRINAGGGSNGSRGVFLGGKRQEWYQGVHNVWGQNEIDYITIGTTGNATDFGNLTDNKSREGAGATNGTRATRAGGCFSDQDAHGGSSNKIDYVTIATTGNATDLADLLDGRHELTGASDGIYGYYAGGRKTTPYYGTQNYFTQVNVHNIDTTGNCTNHGSLSPGRHDTGGSSCGNNDRILWWGGIQVWSHLNNSYNDKIRYQTAGTATNNAQNFGDLSYRRSRIGCVNDLNRAVGMGGHYSGNTYDRWPAGSKIDYVTFATTGNATNFGTLSSSTWNMSHDSYKGHGAGVGASGT